MKNQQTQHSPTRKMHNFSKGPLKRFCVLLNTTYWYMRMLDGGEIARAATWSWVSKPVWILMKKQELDKTLNSYCWAIFPHILTLKHVTCQRYFTELTDVAGAVLQLPLSFFHWLTQWVILCENIFNKPLLKTRKS